MPATLRKKASSRKPSPTAPSSPASSSPRLVAAMALLSFFWTPYDVTKLIVADRMLPPSATHIFGTDQFGRDVLSMIMVGARNSIAVALVAVGIGMGIGAPLGCWAAARGGYIDDALMRFNDIVFAFLPCCRPS